MNVIYKTIALMDGLNESDVSITLNKEFISKTLSSKEIKEFIESYFEGGISKETLLYNLRKGGVLDPLRTDEDELKSIVNLADKSKGA